MLSSRNALTEAVFYFSTSAQLCFTLRVLTEKQSLLSFRNSLKKQNPHCFLLLKFPLVYAIGNNNNKKSFCSANQLFKYVLILFKEQSKASFLYSFTYKEMGTKVSK